MIPLFPNFKHIELLDKKEIEEIVSKYPPYEDFSFVNLWSFDIENDVLISKLYNNLVIRFHDYTTSDRFYSFIGNQKVKKTIEELLKRAEEEDVLHYLKLIPEDVILPDNTLYNSFSIKEDRDNFDYIMLLDDLSNLPGKKYGKKRWKLNKFIRSNPNLRFEILDLKNRSLNDDFLNTFYTWGEQKKLHREEMQHELLALKKLLRIADVLDLQAAGIYNNKLLVGFTINEIINNNYAMGHFIKADSSIEGIYEFFNKMIADQLLSQGCTYINIQQDLGIKGLRTSKQSWRPNHFLKKYIISKKNL